MVCRAEPAIGPTTDSCRPEFRDLGGAGQVLRVLRNLVREKRQVRLGYGVSATPFRFTERACAPATR